MSTLGTVLAFVPWDPWIIGVLSVLIGVLVLCGSVYLLLATNTGVRLGFLLAWTGFFAWMFLLGIIWWIYAIGLVGDLPEWEVDEVLTGDGVAFSEIEAVRDLPVIEATESVSSSDVPDEWRSLSADDPLRGEAQSIADEALLSDPAITSLFGNNPGTDDYITTAAFQTGGDRWPTLFGYDGKPLGWFGDPNHVVIQVQPATPAPPPDPNSAPPPRTPDAGEEVLSVVLTRNLGSERFPPFLVTLASGLAFGLGAYLLHQRDKALWAAQAEPVKEPVSV
ncbi:MAG: hypothetical protein AAFZ07_08580 [Actinomycetota bacterium]